MNLNKAEIDIMVAAMENADVAIDDAAAAVTAASWEETESDDGHRELYEEDWRDGQPDEAQEWHDFDPDC